MLTREILKANAELNGLTDEQLSAIETLSKNDENSVIGARIGEVYRQMDTTIANATGIQRNGDEKTYLYLERAAKELNEKVKSADALNQQISDLTKEKNRLEKVIAEGGSDSETKKALAQAQKDLVAVTNQFNELKTKYDETESNHAKEILGLRIENELKAATANIRFKKELPEGVTRVILDQEIAKVKGMNPEYAEDGKTIVFKDTEGAIMKNTENRLNPYTASELILKGLKTLGVLDEGRQIPGGGTKTPTNDDQNVSGIDVTGAKTKGEANEMVTQALLAKGLINGSAEFQKELNQAWVDNNIASLPDK